MKSSYSIEIDASPDRVWHWLNDSQRIMEWVPNIVENEDLEVTENGVGTTFRQVYEENGKRMEMFGVVTGYEPERRLALEIIGAAFSLLVDYRLEYSGAKTRLTQNVDVRFKGLMRILGFFISMFMKEAGKKQQEESFMKLKHLVESGAEQEAGAS